jgi:hypothetical protein
MYIYVCVYLQKKVYIHKKSVKMYIHKNTNLIGGNGRHFHFEILL